MRWPFTKNRGAISNKAEARRHYNNKDYANAEPHLDAILRKPNHFWAMDYFPAST